MSEDYFDAAHEESFCVCDYRPRIPCSVHPKLVSTIVPFMHSCPICGQVHETKLDAAKCWTEASTE